MKHLIDKDTLLARIKKLNMDIGNIFNEYEEGFWDGRTSAFDDVICALDTIEVKEVDLEKEYKDFVEEDPVYNKLVNGIVGKAIAKHFFELGIKAQKGD